MAELIMQEEASTPSTPSSGKWKTYFKSDGLYIKDDAGNEIGPLGKTTTIEGLQLIWNSGTSLSIGTGICYAENGDKINVTSALTASSLSLSNSTWYHVYVYLSGGSPAMEVVTTAPVAWKGTAYSKTGNTSRRYIGSVKTNGSGSVYEFEHNPVENFIFYRNVQYTASPFRVASSVTAATATAASVSGIVPVTANFLYYRFTSSGDQVFYVGYNSSLSSSNWAGALQIGSTIQQQAYIKVPQDGSQNIYYKFNTTVGVGNASIDINGYYFKR